MNYYCNQKFWYMAVHPERQELSACCEASTEKIKLEWLQNNPGQLFNTDQLIKDRTAMLENRHTSSCDTNCWNPERQGLLSRHLRMGGTNISHTDTKVYPTELNLILGTDCNLTCSYCNRYYSTSWLRDIVNNGTYEDNNARFDITTSDRAVLKIGQKTLVTGKGYQAIIDEVTAYDSLSKVEITGGEPFLYNDLIKILNKFHNKVNFNIVTGLGIDHKRLSRILLQLPKDRVTLSVSMENLNEQYEFNRYGNSYSNLLNNLDLINSLSIPFKSYSVVSNLTIFGFRNFLDKFGDQDFTNMCVDPMYLSAHVMDAESKNVILSTDYGKHTTDIHAVVAKEPTEQLRMQAGAFINEFAKRRNLNLDIFPTSFVNWLNIK
jgi:organic radical activating enzyme